jgi:hypothetical protein
MLCNFFWKTAFLRQPVDKKQKLPAAFKGQLPLAST